MRLKVEYLNAPIGIDIVKPRFFWNCEGGEKQTAYQIICKRAGETVWDSGKVESSAMTRIPYVGKPLCSRDVITWAVKLWDEQGNGGEITASQFEIGLLDADDWKAKWISGNYAVNPLNRYPVDCFRKCFKTADIVNARLYITACGVYEAVKRYEECEKSSLKLTNQGGFKTKAEEMKEKYYDILCAPRFYPAGSSMDIVYDEGYFEIFAEDGLAVFSMMTYPRQPFTECNTKMYT